MEAALCVGSQTTGRDGAPRGEARGAGIRDLAFGDGQERDASSCLRVSDESVTVLLCAASATSRADLQLNRLAPAARPPGSHGPHVCPDVSLLTIHLLFDKMQGCQQSGPSRQAQWPSGP